MDNKQFDRLARVISGATTRRRALQSIAAFAATALLPRRVAAVAGLQPVGRCGGIAGFQCPACYTCVDDPFDSCDPRRGGADCLGICVPEPDYNPCAAVLCVEGSICCPNCGGTCVPAGTDCNTVDCGGETCGSAVCGLDEFCCNRSCSVCAPLGGFCTEEFCGGETCGTAVCGPDEYCCNESCSTCAPIGGVCTREYCGDVPKREVCGDKVCPPGEVCCNASCGICTPPGGACIMIGCLS